MNRGAPSVIRAAVCPSPPLLAAELAGRADVLPGLRTACAAAVARLLAANPDVVVVTGAGAATATWDPDDRLDLSGYAPALGTGGKPGLPLAVGLGAMLLDAAGYAGPRVLQAVDEQAPPAECLGVGASLPGLAPRVGLLAMGDGSARRGVAAPGYLDPRAASFDASVERALREGDMAALTGLDPDLARDLLATGRAAWQVLAGAMSAPGTASGPAGRVLYADAPLGVGYFVAVLDPPDREPVPVPRA
ncbi:MAG TPA: hypothetical protein VH136_12320 [Trebonia sp.]|nr:hypothetical protein [Trebonia sp.]